MIDDKLAIIVPMKPFAQAKQRLRPAVNDAERMALARSMLLHVLAAIHNSGAGELRILVSADPEVLALAPAFDFTPLTEENAGYNNAVAQAIAWAQNQEATTILVLPADLPQLRPGDVCDLVRLAGGAPRAVVLAPDEAGSGTNALLLRPPSLIPPSFGPDSFSRHQLLARGLGVEPRVHRHPHLGSDIDRPSHLCLL